MPKVVKSEAREMILKVKEFCEAELKNKEALIPLKNVRARVAVMTDDGSDTLAESKTNFDCTGDNKVFGPERNDALIEYFHKVQCHTSESQLFNKYISLYDNELEKNNKQTEVFAVYNVNDDSCKIDNKKLDTSKIYQLIKAPIDKEQTFSDRYSNLSKETCSQNVIHTVVEEKSTYCKPVLDVFNKSFITDMMERNSRLQNLIIQLIRETQTKDSYKRPLTERLKQSKDVQERLSSASKSQKQLEDFSKRFLKEVLYQSGPSLSDSFNETENLTSKPGLRRNKPISSKTLMVRHQEVSCDILKGMSNIPSPTTFHNNKKSSSNKSVQCNLKKSEYQTNSKLLHENSKRICTDSLFQADMLKNIISENNKAQYLKDDELQTSQTQEIQYKRYFPGSKCCDTDSVNSIKQEINETLNQSIGLLCTMDLTPTYLTYDLRSNLHDSKKNGEYLVIPKYQKNKAMSFSYDSVIDKIHQQNQTLNGHTCLYSVNSQLNYDQSTLFNEPEKKDQQINCTIEFDLNKKQSCHLEPSKIELQFQDACNSNQESINSKLSLQYSVNHGTHKVEDKQVYFNSDLLTPNTLNYNKSVMISCHSLLNRVEPVYQAKSCQISRTSAFSSKHIETSYEAYSEPNRKDQQVHCYLETDLKSNKSVMMSSYTILNKIEPKNQDFNFKTCRDSINSHQGSNSSKASHGTYKSETIKQQQNCAIDSECQSYILSKQNLKQSTASRETINKQVNCTLESNKKIKTIIVSSNSVSKTQSSNQGLDCDIKERLLNRKPLHMSFNKIVSKLEEQIHKNSNSKKYSEHVLSDQHSNSDKSSLIIKQSLLNNDSSYLAYVCNDQVTNKNSHSRKCLLCNHFRRQNQNENGLNIEKSSLIDNHNFVNYKPVSFDEASKLSFFLYDKLHKQNEYCNSNIEQSSANMKEVCINDKLSTQLNRVSIETSLNDSLRQYQDSNYYYERGSLNTQLFESDDSNGLLNNSRKGDKERKLNASITNKSSSNIELQYSSLSNQLEEQNQNSHDSNSEYHDEGSLARVKNSLSYQIVRESIEKLQQQISNEQQDIKLQDSFSNKEKVTSSEDNNDDENKQNSGVCQMTNNEIKIHNFMSLEKLVREHHKDIVLILQKYDFSAVKDKETQVKIDHSSMTHEDRKILRNSINDMTQTYSNDTSLYTPKKSDEKDIQAKEESERLIQIQDTFSPDATTTKILSSKAILVENPKLLSNLIEIRLVKEDSDGFEVMNQGLGNVEKKLETLMESMNRFMLEMRSKKSSKLFRHKKIFVNSEYNAASLVNMATSVSLPFTKQSEEIGNQQLTGSSISNMPTECDSNVTNSKSINSNEYSQIFKKMSSLLKEIEKTTFKSSQAKSHNSNVDTVSTHPTHSHTSNILQDSKMLNDKRSARTSEIMNIAINTDPVGFLSLMKTMLSYMPNIIKQYSFIKNNEIMETTLETTLEAAIEPEPGPAMTTPPPPNELIPQTQSKSSTIARSCLSHLSAECPFDCKYCGQKFMRAYCWELHQVSCAKRVGLKHDNNQKLMFLI